jgi:hypothetical protein
MDCNAIRGTAYLSPEEGDWYRANCTGTTAPTATKVPSSGGGGTTPNNPPSNPTPVPPTATTGAPTFTVLGWAISSPSGVCQQGPVCDYPSRLTPNGGSMQDCSTTLYVWIKLHNVPVPVQLTSTMYAPTGDQRNYSYPETDSEHAYWVLYTDQSGVPSGTFRLETYANGKSVSTATVNVYCP